MPNEIRMGTRAMTSAKASLRDGIEAYGSLRLSMLSGALPTSASALHDGALAASMTAALDAYRAMIESDVTAVQDMGNALMGVDVRAAALFGLG